MRALAVILLSARLTHWNTYLIFLQTYNITLKSMINPKLSQQRFWPYHENGHIKIVQQYGITYASLKLASLYCNIVIHNKGTPTWNSHTSWGINGMVLLSPFSRHGQTLCWLSLELTNDLQVVSFENTTLWVWKWVILLFLKPCPRQHFAPGSGARHNSQTRDNDRLFFFCALALKPQKKRLLKASWKDLILWEKIQGFTSWASYSKRILSMSQLLF